MSAAGTAPTREAEFFDRLAGVGEVGQDDCLHAMLLLATGRSGTSFQERLEYARQLGLVDRRIERPASEAATFGDVSVMIDRLLTRRADRSPIQATDNLYDLGILPVRPEASQGLTGLQLISLLGATEDRLGPGPIARLTIEEPIQAPSTLLDEYEQRNAIPAPIPEPDPVPAPSPSDPEPARVPETEPTPEARPQGSPIREIEPARVQRDPIAPAPVVATTPAVDPTPTADPTPSPVAIVVPPPRALPEPEPEPVRISEPVARPQPVASAPPIIESESFDDFETEAPIIIESPRPTINEPAPSIGRLQLEPLPEIPLVGGSVRNPWIALTPTPPAPASAPLIRSKESR